MLKNIDYDKPKCQTKIKVYVSSSQITPLTKCIVPTLLKKLITVQWNNQSNKKLPY